MEVLLIVIGIAIGVALGLIAGAKRGAQRERELFNAEVGSAKQEAERILQEARTHAETDAKDAKLAAKQSLFEQQAAFDKEVKKQRGEQHEIERELRKREQTLDKRVEKLDKLQSELQTRERSADEVEKKSDKTRQLAENKLVEAQKRLEEVSSLTADEARRQLIAEIETEAKLEAAKTVKQLEEEAHEEAEKRANKIVGVAIQRYAGEYVTERCVRTIQLPSDDAKGRIIGREGRNIRAIEAATGVDLIIDDTPEAVVISAFDPVRRQIASLSLQRLIADGRIHPGRIEEVVDKVKNEVDQVIKESGEQAAFELGLHGLHTEILRLLGRLRYRTSYGQNMWSHALEVGWLCGIMAGELGLSVKKARRAGLLHDLGKALDHEMEGSHAVIGADFAKKHGEKPDIVNAIAAHHNDVPPESVMAYLVMAADALWERALARAGEILETYIKRLQDIEDISTSFPGVDKCYAIQAGREVRIIVDHARVTDAEATVLSRDIAKRIEEELTYPGRIKVCVIRETRATEYAR